MWSACVRPGYRRRLSLRQGRERRSDQDCPTPRSNGRCCRSGTPGTGKTHTIANLITHHLSKGNQIFGRELEVGPARSHKGRNCPKRCGRCASPGWTTWRTIRTLSSISSSALMSSTTTGLPEMLRNSRKNERNFWRRNVVSDEDRRESAQGRGAFRDQRGVLFLARLAKELHEQIRLKDAVPGPIVCEGPLPLSWEDISYLRKTHGRWVGDHPELSNPLPRTEDLPTPGTVREWDAVQVKGKDAALSFEIVEGDQNARLIRALLRRPAGYGKCRRKTLGIRQVHGWSRKCGLSI